MIGRKLGDAFVLSAVEHANPTSGSSENGGENGG
jgi:hypothetical protein